MFLSTCDPILTVPVTAFNEIVYHAVAWGASYVEGSFELDSGHMQQVLSRGLAYLRAIAAAETYDERYQVLYEPNPKSSLGDFLHEGLSLSNGPHD